MNIEAVQRYVDIASFNYQMDREKFLFIIEPVLMDAEGEDYLETYKFVDSEESIVVVGFMVKDQVVGIFANPETDKIIVFVGPDDVIERYGVFESTDIWDVISKLREEYAFIKEEKK